MSLIKIDALECPACHAPYNPGQARCQFCGSPLPAPPAAEPLPERPWVGPERADRTIVDFYALLGLTAAHLIEGPLPDYDDDGEDDDLFAGERRLGAQQLRRPPSQLEVREAALAAQQRILLGGRGTGGEAEARLEQIELAGWILTDERARASYDAALVALRSGRFTEGHFNLLDDLQRRAREALGLTPPPGDGTALLRQGAGLQGLGMHREAADALRQAAAVLPDSAEAHYRYGQALLASDDPVGLGPHNLRQARGAFARALELDARLTDAPGLVALCEGLLARQSGDLALAQARLREAVRVLPRLGAGWRALAAIAMQQGRHDEVLAYCRQALLADGHDERAYELLVAACWRAGQRQYAQDAASRLAALRGEGWDATRVLAELVGN
jgi:predicted Zn-dependent protease